MKLNEFVAQVIREINNGCKEVGCPAPMSIHMDVKLKSNGDVCSIGDLVASEIHLIFNFSTKI